MRYRAFSCVAKTLPCKRGGQRGQHAPSTCYRVMRSGRGHTFRREKYNMLHFITLKVRVPASIGFWVPKTGLLRGYPLKPRRCPVSDFESREHSGSATDRRPQPAASQHANGQLEGCHAGTNMTAAHRLPRALMTVHGKGD